MGCLLLAALIHTAPLHAEQSWARVHADAQLLRDMNGSTDAIDYGSFQWLPVDEATHTELQKAGIRVERIADPFTLVLGGQRLDLKQDVSAEASGWGGLPAPDGDGPDLRLIQFNGPVKQSWLQALRADGIEPVQYLHPFTYVVWGTATQLSRHHQQQGHSRHVGDFLPAWRVQPQWRDLGANSGDVIVMVYRRAPDTDNRLQAQGAQLIDRDGGHDPQFRYLRMRIAPGNLATAAQVAGVYSIQPVPTDGGLRGEMSNQINAGNHHADNMAFSGYLAYLQDIGVDGSGVIVADVDGGVHHANADLVNRMVSCAGATCAGTVTDNHGTHTAAIIAGDGSSGVTTDTGFLRGLGMAPGANLIDQLYAPTFTQPGGMLMLMADSASNGALVSANSWGPSGSPRGYDGDTRQVDIGVRNALSPDGPAVPLSYVLSIMNGNGSGSGGIGRQGSPDEGKNLFAIGSTRMQSSPTVQYSAIDDISPNSAHGPARDGRNLPHMVAPGCSVDSAVSNTGYGLMCGTSMASPHVSGAAALFIDYFRQQGFDDPSPAMIKAAFMAVARDLTGNSDANGGTITKRFDSRQGWGRLQVTPVLAPEQSVAYFDQLHEFTATGQSWSKQVHADDPNQPMRIMLTWTDAPGHGLGGSAPAWNNNLDLRVHGSADTWLGNVFDGEWSSSGGDADIKHNMEGVFLAPEQHGGSVELEVFAADINSDGVAHVAGDTRQDFALACYNCKTHTPSADLGIQVVAQTPVAFPGQALEMEITIENLGPDNATAVGVTVQRDPAVMHGDLISPGWFCAHSLGLRMHCRSDAELEAGESATLSLSSDIPLGVRGALTWQFEAGAEEIDVDAGNNSVTLVVPVDDDGLFRDGFELPAPAAH